MMPWGGGYYYGTGRREGGGLKGDSKICTGRNDPILDIEGGVITFCKRPDRLVSIRARE